MLSGDANDASRIYSELVKGDIDPRQQIVWGRDEVTRNYEELMGPLPAAAPRPAQEFLPAPESIDHPLPPERPPQTEVVAPAQPRPPETMQEPTSVARPTTDQPAPAISAPEAPGVLADGFRQVLAHDRHSPIVDSSCVGTWTDRPTNGARANFRSTLPQRRKTFKKPMTKCGAVVRRDPQRWTALDRAGSRSAQRPIQLTRPIAPSTPHNRHTVVSGARAEFSAAGGAALNPAPEGTPLAPSASKNAGGAGSLHRRRRQLGFSRVFEERVHSCHVKPT